MARALSIFERRIPPLVVLLVVVAIPSAAIIHNVQYQKRYRQYSLAIHAEGGCEELANLLQQKSATGELPEDPDVEDITGDPDWGFVVIDARHFGITMDGSDPEYQGTVIRCNDPALHGPVQLTVANLQDGDWELKTEPVPEWWEF